MRRSPAPTLGCADNWASDVVGNDRGRIHGDQPQPQVLGEMPKNSHDAFRLVETRPGILEIQLVRRDGRGGVSPRQRFAFAAKHAERLQRLFQQILPAAQGEMP